MTDEKNWEKKISDNSLTILAGIFLVAVISIVVVVGVYWYYFNNQLVRIDPEPWGQFGDFLGGTLNPIFGFLSVMALLAALIIQSRELKISSQELRNSALALEAQNKAIIHQSFEQTFFSWLDSYGEMLSSIVDPMSANEAPGRQALKNLWRQYFTERNLTVLAASRYREMEQNEWGQYQYNDFEEIFANTPNALSEVAMDAWNALYQANEYQLDSVFRYLYRLILWIDSQPEDQLTPAQKWFYVSIVRAQLSWIEMVYLFYNGYTQRGERLNRLIEKYSLFNNLNFDSDPVIAHIRKHGCNNIRYAETAYDSSKARIRLGLPESSEETLALAVV